MTYMEALALVQNIVTQIQEISGREVIPITEETVPIGGVPGFDSLCAVDFTGLVEAAVPAIGDIQNICVSKDGTRALAASEIASRIVEATAK